MKPVRSTVAVALLLASVAATASQIEDALNPACALLGQPELEDEYCKYQFDGGEHGDASDDCSSPNREVLVGHDSTGLLVAVDDTRDYYQVNMSANGTLTVTLSALPWHKAGLDRIGLALYDVDCSTALAAGSRGVDGTLVAKASVAAGTYTILVYEVVVGELTETPEQPDHGPVTLVIDLPARCHGLCDLFHSYRFTTAG